MGARQIYMPKYVTLHKWKLQNVQKLEQDICIHIKILWLWFAQLQGTNSHLKREAQQWADCSLYSYESNCCYYIAVPDIRGYASWTQGQREPVPWLYLYATLRRRRRRRRCRCRPSAVCNSLILTLTNSSLFIMHAHKGGSGTGEKDTRSAHAAGSQANRPTACQSDSPTVRQFVSPSVRQSSSANAIFVSSWRSDGLSDSPTVPLSGSIPSLLSERR